MKKKTKCLEEWKLLDETTGEVFSIPSMPMQVHEILAFHGKIGDGWKWGKTADCAWVNAHDWRYEGSFSCEGPDVLLQCEGLDTVCEIQVNGKQAGTWKDCYLPAVFDLKGVAKPGKNLLTIRFPSMNQVMKEMEERHQEEIQKDGLKPAVFLRKTFHDFTTYLGNDDNFWKIGVFGDLWILEPEEGDFLDTPEITYVLNETLTTADIAPILTGNARIPDIMWKFQEMARYCGKKQEKRIALKPDYRTLPCGGQGGMESPAFTKSAFSCTGMESWWMSRPEKSVFGKFRWEMCWISGSTGCR